VIAASIQSAKRAVTAYFSFETLIRIGLSVQPWLLSLRFAFAPSLDKFFLQYLGKMADEK